MIDRTTIEADSRRCWESADSAALRTEFGGDFARYLSYRLACATGSVRVLGAKVGEDGELTPRASAVVR